MIETEKEPASNRVINTLARKMDDIADIDGKHMYALNRKMDEVLKKLEDEYVSESIKAYKVSVIVIAAAVTAAEIVSLIQYIVR